jgi:hypothetical protein
LAIAQYYGGQKQRALHDICYLQMTAAVCSPTAANKKSLTWIKNEKYLSRLFIFRKNLEFRPVSSLRLF